MSPRKRFPTMTVQEYVELRKQELDKFAAWYEQERAKAPKHFREKSDEPEWYEQEIAWMESAEVH